MHKPSMVFLLGSSVGFRLRYKPIRSGFVTDFRIGAALNGLRKPLNPKPEP